MINQFIIALAANATTDDTSMVEKILTLFTRPTFWSTVILLTTPILFAALGSILCKRAGILNMTLEGCMNFSALMAVFCSAWVREAVIGGQTAATIGKEAFDSLTTTANTWACIAGLLGAIIFGLLLELFYAFLTIQLRSSFTLTGIAVNLMMSALTIYLISTVAGNKSTTSTWKVSGSIPSIGPMSFRINLLTFVAIICIFIVWVILYRTATGLRIRAIGENAHAAESVGINVKKVQFTAIILTGIFTSLGGAFLSMSYINYFTKNMASSRGWIGLSAANLGNGVPGPTAAVSILFGFFDTLALEMRTLDLQQEFIAMLPYIATLLGLVFYALNTQRKIKKARAQR